MRIIVPPHECTSHTPYELMFGRLPHIAIDIELNMVNGGEASHSKFAQDIKEKLEYSHASAKKAMESAAKRAKSTYDSKFCSASLEIGDHVLVKKTGFQNRHKLSDKWDDVTYVVVKKPCVDVPMYEVQSVLDCANKKTLHRNMLLPLRKLNKTSVYKPVENIPNIPTTNENTNVPDMGRLQGSCNRLQLRLLENIMITITITITRFLDVIDYDYDYMLM